MKRVAPKTPESADLEKSAPSKNAKKAETTKLLGKVVGDKPNCDDGFKLDQTGKQCVPAKAAKEPEKKTASKSAVKKKR